MLSQQRDVVYYDLVLSDFSDGYFTESASDKIKSIINKIVESFNKVIERIVSFKKEKVNSNPNDKIEVDAEQYKKTHNFIQACLKVLKMPFKVLAKMISNPGKTLIIGILGFSAVNMYKAGKEREDYRRKHEIPKDRKVIMAEIENCKIIAEDCNKHLKTAIANRDKLSTKYRENTKELSRLLKSDEIPKVYKDYSIEDIDKALNNIKNMRKNPPKNSKLNLDKSEEKLKKLKEAKLNVRDTAKKGEKMKKKISGYETKAKKNMDRARLLDDYLNSGTISFFQHIAKTVTNLISIFKKLLSSPSSNKPSKSSPVKKVIEKVSNKK